MSPFICEARAAYSSTQYGLHAHSVPDGVLAGLRTSLDAAMHAQDWRAAAVVLSVLYREFHTSPRVIFDATADLCVALRLQSGSTRATRHELTRLGLSQYNSDDGPRAAVNASSSRNAPDDQGGACTTDYALALSSELCSAVRVLVTEARCPPAERLVLTRTWLARLLRGGLPAAALVAASDVLDREPAANDGACHGYAAIAALALHTELTGQRTMRRALWDRESSVAGTTADERAAGPISVAPTRTVDVEAGDAHRGTGWSSPPMATPLLPVDAEDAVVDENAHVPAATAVAAAVARPTDADANGCASAQPRSEIPASSDVNAAAPLYDVAALATRQRNRYNSVASSVFEGSVARSVDPSEAFEAALSGRTGRKAARRGLTRANGGLGTATTSSSAAVDTARESPVAATVAAASLPSANVADAVDADGFALPPKRQRRARTANPLATVPAAGREPIASLARDSALTFIDADAQYVGALSGSRVGEATANTRDLLSDAISHSARALELFGGAHMADASIVVTLSSALWLAGKRKAAIAACRTAWRHGLAAFLAASDGAVSRRTLASQAAVSAAVDDSDSDSDDQGGAKPAARGGYSRASASRSSRNSAAIGTWQQLRVLQTLSQRVGAGAATGADAGPPATRGMTPPSLPARPAHLYPTWLRVVAAHTARLFRAFMARQPRYLTLTGHARTGAHEARHNSGMVPASAVAVLSADAVASMRATAVEPDAVDHTIPVALAVLRSVSMGRSDALALNAQTAALLASKPPRLSLLEFAYVLGLEACLSDADDVGGAAVHGSCVSAQRQLRALLDDVTGSDSMRGSQLG